MDTEEVQAIIDAINGVEVFTLKGVEIEKTTNKIYLWFRFRTSVEQSFCF